MSTRDIFRRAEGSEAPDVERLVRAMPVLIAQAQRLRRLEDAPSTWIFAVGSAWLPRLAVATALLAVAALLWPSASTRRESAGDDSRVVDAWLVTGSVSSSVADPALDAILRQGTP